MGELGGGDEMLLLRTRAQELEAELASLREQIALERARHAAAIERARLEAATRTARRVTHELRNLLSPVAGYGELLTRRVSGEDAALAERVKSSALRAADFLAQLDHIVRYCEVEFGGETMLDLHEATGRAKG
jgi:signal transduction histidine kinase